LDVLFDSKIFEEKAVKSIQLYGHDAEHNFSHFLNQQTIAKLPVFFGFDSFKGVLAFKSRTGKLWYMFSEVLAPADERFDVFLKFVDYVFNVDCADRLQIEVESGFRDLLKSRLDNFRVGKEIYSLEWPLFDMKVWNGDRLEGKDWKKLRNLLHKFLREHKVEVVDSSSVSKADLSRIVVDWNKRRGADDFVRKHGYMNFIDNGFAGCDIAKSLVVDGVPCSITAGWRIPNSDSYYSAIGILDYSVDGLGEVANLYDLFELKKRNFGLVNFGGSDPDLLEFKKKFRPSSSYKTHIFSIMRKG